MAPTDLVLLQFASNSNAYFQKAAGLPVAFVSMLDT